MSRVHGTLTPTRAESTGHYLQHTAVTHTTDYFIKAGVMLKERYICKVPYTSRLSATFVVGSNESKYVLMSEHDGLIDLGLTEP